MATTRDVCQKLVEAADEASGVLLDLMRDVTVEPQVRPSAAQQDFQSTAVIGGRLFCSDQYITGLDNRVHLSAPG
jgi:hypothetical protein